MLQPLILLLMVLAPCLKAVPFETNDPFYGQHYAKIDRPRGLLVDTVGDILVLSRDTSSVFALYETPIQNKDGSSLILVEKVLIINGKGLSLNHGLTMGKNNFLYASSSNTVYRWPYVSGQRELVTAEPEVVVHNIVSGMHVTRTLAVDPDSKLIYVSIGSSDNVDPDSSKARIRRFDLDTIPDGGFDFEEGQIFADGVRNEVGFQFDLNGTLWGVGNQANYLSRPDLGNDLEVDLGNPAEELTIFDGPLGTHYGFPYCFTTYEMPGYPPGTQFAWPSFMTDGIHSDDWCRNSSNNHPPTLALPAHQAPLGITFYKGEGACDVGDGAFPCEAVGDPIVAFHGSGDPSTPNTGRVGWLPLDRTTGRPTGQILDIIYNPFTETPTQCGEPCFRPVNAVFNRNGHLIISSDNSHDILRVTYKVPPTPVNY